MTQAKFGLAFVLLIGQIFSPTLGLSSCVAFVPLNFCEGGNLPLAAMSWAVYLPPGVKNRARSSSLVAGAGISPSPFFGDVKGKRKRSSPMRRLRTVISTFGPRTVFGSVP